MYRYMSLLHMHLYIKGKEGGKREGRKERGREAGRKGGRKY